MPMDEQAKEFVEEFRRYIEDSVAMDERYGPAKRHDRQDESTLATRFEAAPSCWFEIALRPSVPQLRIGFLTDDRWKSEGMEQAIQDSGDTMAEFVGLGFTEAGLDWDEPPIEHFRESDSLYYFVTPMDLEEMGDLESPEVRNKALRMLEGYLIAFGPVIIVEDE